MNHPSLAMHQRILEKTFTPPLREVAPQHPVIVTSFFCETPAGWGGNLLRIDRCAQWYIIRLSLQSQVSRAVDSHTHIHFSTLHCTTQLLTNNLAHRGMWLNAEAEGEQVLLNHKLLQGSRAPAPHPTITIIVIITIAFLL